MSLFSILYYTAMSLMGLFVFVLIFGAATPWVLLAVVVFVIGGGIVSGRETGKKYAAILQNTPGITTSARMLFDRMTKKANYPSIAIIAGAPGILCNESRGYHAEATYQWRDASGACVTACFENNCLSYFTYHP